MWRCGGKTIGAPNKTKWLNSTRRPVFHSETETISFDVLFRTHFPSCILRIYRLFFDFFSRRLKLDCQKMFYAKIIQLILFQNENVVHFHSTMETIQKWHTQMIWYVYAVFANWMISKFIERKPTESEEPTLHRVYNKQLVHIAKTQTHTQSVSVICCSVKSREKKPSNDMRCVILRTAFFVTT